MRCAFGWRLLSILALGCGILLLVPSAARSQSAAPQTPVGAEAPTFKSRVNLVVVPVVVYDKKGQAVGDLKQQDFQIFDDGKPQQITSFNLQTNENESAKAHTNSVLGAALKGNVLGTMPAHYFAYLFDDLHLKTGDLQQVRAAAKKHLESRMSVQDRAAVLTTSGHISLAFTDDKSLLAAAMDRITPHSMGGGIVTRCPYMNFPLALAIVDESGAAFDMSCGTTCNGTPAWNGATEDVWTCLYQREDRLQERARQDALDVARREVHIGEADRNAALLSIRNAVRRLAAMPGTRTLVLVSPGFLTGENHLDQNEAIASALGSQVVINSLDARGLYTGAPDPSSTNGPSTPLAQELEAPANRAGLQMQANVMAELAEGTGGKFFRDSNDLTGAFDRLASPPRFIYMLAFKPEILKENGRYHRLKVSLTAKRGYTIQARHGYYESSSVGDPKKMVTQELEQALFSRDEVHSLPITLNAQYRKIDSERIELVVTTHLDTDGIHFRRVDNTNNDNLTVVCGLFDLNGNYVDAKKQEISLHLTDKTLEQLTAGMNVKTDFDVKTGAYIIRVVVRDSDDAIVSAVNGSAAVP